jgi:hypothetical protein
MARPGESSPAVEGVEPSKLISCRDVLGLFSTFPSAPALFRGLLPRRALTVLLSGKLVLLPLGPAVVFEGVYFRHALLLGLASVQGTHTLVSLVARSCVQEIRYHDALQSCRGPRIVSHERPDVRKQAAIRSRKRVWQARSAHVPSATADLVDYLDVRRRMSDRGYLKYRCAKTVLRGC